MALTTDQKASFLFKQSLGVAETSTIRDFFEESIKGRILVLNNQIWVQSGDIPTTAPTLADGATAGVVQYFKSRTMTAVSGVSNSFYLADLVDSIPFNFGDGSYNYAITNSSGQAIPFGQGDWLVNNAAGTLTFYGSVPSGMPPKISFYKYVGTKGTGGASSLPAIYVVASIAERDALTPKQSDLCVVTGTNQTYAYSSTTWVLLQATGAVDSVNGKTGPVILSAADVGAIPTSEKAAPGGVASLGPDGLVPLSQLPSTTAGVASVNTLTGVVTLTTKEINEDPSTNFYFTDARAKAAAVVDDTTGSQTDQAASVSAMKSYVAAQGAPVTSVNSLTGAVLLSTQNISEGPSSAVWSSGANTLTARWSFACFGNQTSALTCGGYSQQTYERLNTTEILQSNVWSYSGNLTTGRGGTSGAGIVNSGFVCGGIDPNYNTLTSTEIFNGSSWSNAANINNGRNDFGAVGSTNSALIFGGNSTSGLLKKAEIYNGSVWSYTSDLIVALSLIGAAGSKNSAISAGGYNGNSRTPTTQIFNGSVWSLGSSLPQSKQASSAAGISSSSCILLGGTSAGSYGLNYSTTYIFNGSIWFSTSNIPIPFDGGGAAGTINAALGVSGSYGYGNQTQIFNGSFSGRYYLDELAISAISSKKLTGPLSLGATGTTAGSGGIAKFYGIPEFGGSGFLGLKAPDYVYSDVTWTLPSSDGTVGALLKTDGFGNLSWAEPYKPTYTINQLSDYNFESDSIAGSITFSNVEKNLNFDFWTGTGPLNTGRSGLAGSGTQNTALAFGGWTPTVLSSTEKFNGSTWSSTGSLVTARRLSSGSGTQNATLAAGGRDASTNILSSAEKFNGSTWSTTGLLGTARVSLAGCGIQNAALTFGGSTGAVSAVTEKFNGLTWSATGSLLTSRQNLAGSGTQSAALAFGGSTPTVVSNAEKFNSSLWFATSSLLSTRNVMGSSGTQNATLIFGGGAGGYSDSSEKFNGSAWTAVGGLIASRSSLSGSGTQNASLAFGGDQSVSYQASTEKFFGQMLHGFQGIYKGLKNSINIYESDKSITINTGADSGMLQLNVIFDANGGLSNQEKSWISELEREDYQAGEWSASAYLSVARYYLGGCGTQNAALAFGGNPGANYSTLTEKFNSSTWTSTNPLSIGRIYLAGSGTQNSALAFGGYVSGPTPSSLTELFTGTVWFTGASLGFARQNLGGCGSRNATLSFGGDSGSFSSISEKYNGSAWSITGYLTLARYSLAGSGTQNAALAFGGYPASGSPTALTEKFNGLTWSATSSLALGRQNLGGAGTQNATLAFGGYASGSPTGLTEKFNGSLWSTTSSLGTIRGFFGGSGNQNAALAFGGYTGSAITAITEKFNYSIEFIPRTSGYSQWNTVYAYMSVGRYSFAGSGSQNAALAAGGIEGNTGSMTALTEKLEGSIWSTTGSLGIPRAQLTGCGAQNAALAFGGVPSSYIPTALTEKFNGSTWISTGTLITARKFTGGVGNQNAALVFGGDSGTIIASCEKFNGSAWAASGSLGTARYGLAGCGSQNAALAFGGFASGSPTGAAEKFNGSLWTTTATLANARYYLSGCGTQYAGMAIGGATASYPLGLTENFVGSLWLTGKPLNTTRYGFGGTGVQSDSAAFGGYNGSWLSDTEKYTETIIGSLQYG